MSPFIGRKTAKRTAVTSEVNENDFSLLLCFSEAYVAMIKRQPSNTSASAYTTDANTGRRRRDTASS